VGLDTEVVVNETREPTMAQTALLFDTPDAIRLPQASAFDATGFQIGWDHARHRTVPPAEHLHAGHPVRQGWQAGRVAFRQRSLAPTPAVRQWLQLRLAAWLRGQAFEDVQVTPNFIAQLATPVCPVTRDAMASDAAVVDRLCTRAAFAAGNLAVLGPRAARAKAAHGWDEALAFGCRIEAEQLDRIDGLDAAEWMRLGVLMSFTTPLQHAEVASLPLLVLPPNRLRLLNPVQALQVLLTLQFTRAGYARRLADLAAVMPGAAVRQAFQVFMHTLLARRVAAGPQCAGAELRRALEDAWLHPLVQRRWQRLALQLSEADCERIVRYATRRGLAGEGCHWVSRAEATEGWALQTQGRATAARPARIDPHARGTSGARNRLPAHRSAPPQQLPLTALR
jgi:hypothetical protein